MSRFIKPFMNLTVKEITDKAIWTGHFNTFGSETFLQSWEWGEVQKREGYGMKRLGVYANNRVIALAQTVFMRAKRAHMVFVPHGPLMNPLHNTYAEKMQVVKTLRNFLAEKGRKEGYHFIRIASVWENNESIRGIFRDLKFRTSPIYMHAERVWVLDITKSGEELLRNMRKTTRYSIRRAEKEGVIIEKNADLDRFWKIYAITSERENFTPFSRKFINAEYEEFNKTGNALLLSGLLPDSHECAASALIVFTKSSAFYHQGATTHSKIPVSYLLQWRAIEEAKKRGCFVYNFWGTHLPGRTPKNWEGLSLFKQGFGGREIDYVPTQDYVLNPMRYVLSSLFEQYLKFRRGM